MKRYHGGGEGDDEVEDEDESEEWVAFPSRGTAQSSTFLSTANNFLEVFFIQNYCDYQALKDLADTNSELRETIMNYPFGYSLKNKKLFDVNNPNGKNYFLFRDEYGDDIATWDHSIKLWRQFFKKAQFLNIYKWNKYCINSDSSQYLKGVRFLIAQNECSAKFLSNSDFVNFKGIVSLSLITKRNSGVTDQAFEHLAGIQNLDIGFFENITDEAFKYLKGIKTLSIRWYDGGLPRITNEAFKHIQGIKELNIYNIQNLDNGILKYLQKINALNIGYCRQFTDEGFQYLKGIKSLNITYCNQITDESLKHLKGLEYLNITGCQQFDDKSLDYLQGIQHLEMAECLNITDSGIAKLAGILFLDVRKCEQLNGSTLYLLKEANPNITIKCLDDDQYKSSTIAFAARALQIKVIYENFSS